MNGSSTEEEFLFVPLGGSGEVGMNFNLYGLGRPGAHRWVAVDLGITFANGTIPGVEVILPNPDFLEENRDRLEGIVITHGHEDHLGAIAYLWERLECPIYATPFSASIVRRKLAETGLEKRAIITEIPLGGRFAVGPFDLEMITVTHSIPEPNSLVIRTHLGTFLHTADWKFDSGPVIGPTADEEALRRLGDEGVSAILCDSTNVFVPESTGSESDLLGSLTELIGTCKKGVAVACFATNVARLATISAAARANGRDVVLAGRSLERMDAVSRENGYLEDVPAFIHESDAGYLPQDKKLIICTGSQGESRAALARIAAGEHRNVSLEHGDTVIFSSKIIPGNEISIGRLQNQLIRQGVKVITEKDHFVHVSGHPARSELIRMYDYIRPRTCIPVHGELRHLQENARVARECGIKETHVVENGTVVRLAPGASTIVDRVTSGRLVLDGRRVVSLEGDLVRSRNKALYNGMVVVTAVVNGGGRLLGDAKITTSGLIEDEGPGLVTMINKALSDALENISHKMLSDDDKVHHELRVAVRRAFRSNFSKNPVTTIHLVRV